LKKIEAKSSRLRRSRWGGGGGGGKNLMCSASLRKVRTLAPVRKEDVSGSQSEGIPGSTNTRRKGRRSFIVILSDLPGAP